jgi:hypothetical protein
MDRLQFSQTRRGNITVAKPRKKGARNRKSMQRRRVKVDCLDT